MRKRRKRRLKPNWGPILWAGFLLNTVAGLWFSPVTAVRKVRVEGAESWDRARIAAEAGKLRGKPSVALNPRSFESAVLAHPAVRHADFRRSLFGSARLTLAYRQPIATIERTDRLLLDQEGFLFRTGAPLTTDLPSIRLHESALVPALTLAGAWPTLAVADLIARIPAALSRPGLQIEVDSEGALCLNMKQAARIELGGAERLEEKFRALERLLGENPSLLQEVAELNLVEPTRPAVRPRRGVQP